MTSVRDCFHANSPAPTRQTSLHLPRDAIIIHHHHNRPSTDPTNIQSSHIYAKHSVSIYPTRGSEHSIREGRRFVWGRPTTAPAAYPRYREVPPRPLPPKVCSMYSLTAMERSSSRASSYLQQDATVFDSFPTTVGCTLPSCFPSP
jgi:hypothetical protein